MCISLCIRIVNDEEYVYKHLNHCIRACNCWPVRVMFTFIYKCMYMYAYQSEHTYTSICIYICIHMHTCTYKRTYICISMYTYVYVYTYICTPLTLCAMSPVTEGKKRSHLQKCEAVKRMNMALLRIDMAHLRIDIAL